MDLSTDFKGNPGSPSRSLPQVWSLCREVLMVWKLVVIDNTAVTGNPQRYSYSNMQCSPRKAVDFMCCLI
jgi:hypothetical protein